MSQDLKNSLNKLILLEDSSPVVVRRVSPSFVFIDVLEEFADILQKMGATIQTDFFLVPEMNYIELYLKNIFSTLLSNSIKYASPARPLQLSLTAHREVSKAAFVFSDNGAGINTEDNDTGLDLIKNIIELNEGTIEMDSKPGKGTTFRFCLQEYDLLPGNNAILS